MIEYNAGDVPHDVIDYFKQFNIASKLYRELLDKGEKLMASARIVLAEEVELRKSVIASGKGAQGPECMAALNEGMTQLRRVPGFIEDIMKRSKRQQRQLQRAAKLLRAQRGTEKYDVRVIVHRSSESSADDNGVKRELLVLPDVHKSAQLKRAKPGAQKPSGENDAHNIEHELTKSGAGTATDGSVELTLEKPFMITEPVQTNAPGSKLAPAATADDNAETLVPNTTGIQSNQSDTPLDQTETLVYEKVEQLESQPEGDTVQAADDDTAAADDDTTAAADDDTTPAADDDTTPAADDDTTPAADDDTAPTTDDDTTAAAGENTAPAAGEDTAPAAADAVPAAGEDTAQASNDTLQTEADPTEAQVNKSETVIAAQSEAGTAQSEAGTAQSEAGVAQSEESTAQLDTGANQVEPDTAQNSESTDEHTNPE